MTATERVMAENPYTAQQYQKVTRAFLEDPLRQAMIRNMGLLTVFQSIVFTMKNNEIISTEKRWTNEQAKELYMKSEITLKEYSENLLKTLMGEFRGRPEEEKAAPKNSEAANSIR